MPGYVYRGTGGYERPNPSRPMSDAEKGHIATAVLRIALGIEASVAASQERRFRATERTVCSACGALHVGATCDVCRARMEVAS